MSIFTPARPFFWWDATGIKLKKKVTDGTTITTTEYSHGFQYTNGILDFFPHAEGYVKAVPTGAGGPGGPTTLTFKYVFTYTDHLGNIRLKYAQDPSNNNELSILEEDHYYPGACPERSRRGLKHTGYSSRHVVFESDREPEPGVVLTPVNPFLGDSYKYKFQGQEHQDEFGLNWDSFKWRNYMPDIGRFFNVDPLAEKYSYQSPYNFAENKVISHIELEGLEGLHHTKTDKAGNRTHVIEKNIIVLTKQTRSNYSDKKNARIRRNNLSRVNKVKSELNKSYSNAKNTKGESVEFKFNVFGMEVENTKTLGSLSEQREVALEYGLEGAPKFDGGPNDIAPAAIITTNPTGQSSTNGIEIEVEEDSHIGHEVGHALMTRTQENEENKPGTGGLMDDPPGNVRDFEVDKMIEDAVKAIE